MGNQTITIIMSAIDAIDASDMMSDHKGGYGIHRTVLRLEFQMQPIHWEAVNSTHPRIDQPKPVTGGDLTPTIDRVA